MKTWTKGLVVALLMSGVMLGSMPAWAGPCFYPGHGPGRLTPGEIHRLNNQRRHFRRVAARMYADGRLTRHERARLHRMRARARFDRYRYTHNHRPGYGRPTWH